MSRVAFASFGPLINVWRFSSDLAEEGLLTWQTWKCCTGNLLSLSQQAAESGTRPTTLSIATPRTLAWAQSAVAVRPISEVLRAGGLSMCFAVNSSWWPGRCRISYCSNEFAPEWAKLLYPHPGDKLAATTCASRAGWRLVLGWPRFIGS